MCVCVCVCVCVFQVDVSTEQTSTPACLQDSFKILSHCPGCEIGGNIVPGSTKPTINDDFLIFRQLPCLF